MTTTVVDTLKTNIAQQFQATSCYDHGCSLSLDGAPDPNLLIKAEDMIPESQGQLRCDFLFVGGDDQRSDGLWVVPVELSSGRKRAFRFLGQLRAGTELADRLLPADIPVNFCPVAVHGKDLHRRDYDILRSRKIRFRDEEFGVSIVWCETMLLDALQ